MNSEHITKNWEQLFLEKNRVYVAKFLCTFHVNSFKGIALFLAILTVHLVLSIHFLHNEFFTSILYLIAFHGLHFIFTLFPSNLKSLLFYQNEKGIIDDMNPIAMDDFLTHVHHLTNFLRDIYNSLFIKYSLLYISGSLSVIFGILLLIRRLPLCVFLHMTVVAMTAINCFISYKYTHYY